MPDNNTATVETETIVEILGFDNVAMAKVVGEWVANVHASMIADDFAPNDLVDIRERVMELTRFGTEVSKQTRELRETFDKFVKLMYELDVLTPDVVAPIHIPTERKGAGRKPMTAEERIAAFQKRVASGEKD